MNTVATTFFFLFVVLILILSVFLCMGAYVVYIDMVLPRWRKRKREKLLAGSRARF